MKFYVQMGKLLQTFKWLTACCVLVSLTDGCERNEAAPQNSAGMKIVAAENFYGGVAQQIAGKSASIVSILNNANQDPHEFATDAATARAVADADIVIYNGLGYDDWMDKLLGVQGKAGRIVIRVADLSGVRAGDNPHLWYDPHTMPALAAKLSEILKQPENLAVFQNEMEQVTNKIAEIRPAANGMSVTATEPIFGYMTEALGFKMENYGFQLAVMNDTEPSFQQTADFEKCLREKSVRILFYNSQVTDPTTQRMLALAQTNGVPVIGVTETQPTDAKDYADWMLTEVDAIETILKINH